MKNYLQVIINGKLDHIVDGRNEQCSNWMRFVNCARDEMEQNVVAYLEYNGKIFYKTCKTIEPGTELLMWFDRKYCWKLEEQADCRFSAIGECLTFMLTLQKYINTFFSGSASVMLSLV